MKLAYKYPYLTVALFSLLVVSPYFYTSNLSQHKDFLPFAVWMKVFTEEFWAGNLRPQWSGLLQDGFGRPDFYIYPPLVFYLSALFSGDFFHEYLPFFQVAATAALIFVLSGFSFFYAVKQFTDIPKALMGTLIYLLAIPHLSVGLIIRSAIAEQMNYIWLPLIMLYTFRVIKQGAGYAPHLSICLAASLLSNIPSFLVITPLPLLLVTIWAASQKTEGRGKAMAIVAVSYLAMAGLTCFFWLPVLDYRNWLHTECLTRLYNFKDQFIKFDSSSLDFTLIAVPSMIMIVLLGMILFYRRKQEKSAYSEILSPLFFLVVSVAACFMMFSASLSIWEAIPLLELIQFPWRFAIIPVFIFSFALALYFRPNVSDRVSFAFLVVSAIVLVFVVMKAQRVTNLETNIIITDAGKIIAKNISTVPEYYWKDHDIGNCNLESVYQKFVDDYSSFANGAVVGTVGNVGATVVNWKSGRLELDITAFSDSEILLRQFYFPLWYISSTDIIGASLVPDKDTSLIRLIAPKGKGKIVIETQTTKKAKIGIYISLLTFAGVLLLPIRKFINKVD